MAKGIDELERTAPIKHLSETPDTPEAPSQPPAQVPGGMGSDSGAGGATPEPETDPTVQTPLPEESTEATEGETLAEGAQAADQGEEEETGEIIAVDCDHGWYPELTIGLGGLGLVLLIVVIIQAIKMGSMKKRLSRRSRKGRNAPAPVEAPNAPAPLSGAVQVGKLHCLGDRESQQDCLAVSPESLYGAKGLLAVVADGMGGLSDGDKMSQTAASTMMNGFMSARDLSGDSLMALVLSANQAVNQLLGPNQGRSGTTLVGGIIKDGLFSYVSVGDSRICLYRQGMLTQLNREHVYRNELIVQAINGVGTLWDSATHPKAAGLTSYLGMGSLKYVDIPAEPIRLRGGDKIILMSDGVYNAMTLPEMESALALPAQQAADTIAQIIAAKAYRHQDNYTAVILEV